MSHTQYTQYNWQASYISDDNNIGSNFSSTSKKELQKQKSLKKYYFILLEAHNSQNRLCRFLPKYILIINYRLAYQSSQF